jgi:hypothetical protein
MNFPNQQNVRQHNFRKLSYSISKEETRFSNTTVPDKKELKEIVTIKISA